MDDKKDKGPRGPRKSGPRTGGFDKGSGGKGERAARKPGPRRDGPAAANDSRRDSPREFNKFKGPRPARADGDRPRGDRPSGGGDERPVRKPGPRRDRPTPAHDSPREFNTFRTPRTEGAPTGGDRPRPARPVEGGGERPARRFGPRGDGSAPANDRGGEKPREFRKFTPRAEGAPAERDRPRGERTFGDKPRPGRTERDGARAAGSAPPFKKEFRSGDRPPRGPAERRDGGKREFDSRGRDPRRLKDDLPEAGKERIAKRLARAGIASRRDAEALIEAGRVRVNGTALSSPAFNVAPSDRIEVDGTEIPPVERTRLFLFHKPSGVVTTNRDPEGRRTVFDILPADLPRVVTVGRLDINTEGLLLLTNDGGLSRVLELPSTGWLRRYRVRVHGDVDEKSLAGLKDGIAVDGVFYGSIEATMDRTQGSNAWLTISLREGKNREVKNILGALGLEVTRLIRISFGPFQLGELAEGAVQELKGKMLREQLGERLIEEAGANFDAPIVNQFSNSPVTRDDRPPPEAEAPKRDWGASRSQVGEGGLIKNRKREREDRRETALSRLGTKPPRGFVGKGSFGGKPSGGKPYGGKSDPRGKKEDDAPAEPHAQRRANVWMAPGAKPAGNKKLAKAEDGARKPRAASGRPRADGPPRGDRPPRNDGPPRGDRPPRRDGQGGGGAGPRRGGNADRRR